MEEIQANPKPQKSGATTVLVLVIILLLISNIVTAYLLLMDKDEVVKEEQTIEQEMESVTEPAVEEEEEILIPELQSAVIGEAVDLGDYTLTLLQIDEDMDEDAVSISPTEGYKYVSIEILLENKTDSLLMYANDWTLYDGEGYDYSTYSRREPRFATSGNVPVNGTTRGWLNFRTIEGAEDFSVKFNDSLSGYSVEFTLD